ncbi:hypothetical protein GUJ93_ZPchr0006g44574 [Zizania palustris]|uniref:Uncharacterized protein n=1 Tax=Zizania palustris TaxID=103762 RepID=A0A8J5TEW8_ZIZPA|nr:hypothetical protein GUJ93_ZPchr0006g44574 [Zizania palustris]
MNFGNPEPTELGVLAPDAASVAASGVSSESSMELVVLLPPAPHSSPLPPVAEENLDNIVLPIHLHRDLAESLVEVASPSPPRFASRTIKYVYSRRPKIQPLVASALDTSPVHANHNRRATAKKCKTPLSDLALRRSLRLRLKSMGFKRCAQSSEASPSLPAQSSIRDFIKISRFVSILPTLSVPQIQHSATHLCGLTVAKVSSDFLLSSGSEEHNHDHEVGATSGAADASSRLP